LFVLGPVAGGNMESGPSSQDGERWRTKQALPAWIASAQAKSARNAAIREQLAVLEELPALRDLTRSTDWTDADAVALRSAAHGLRNCLTDEPSVRGRIAAGLRWLVAGGGARAAGGGGARSSARRGALRVSFCDRATYIGGCADGNGVGDAVPGDGGFAEDAACATSRAVDVPAFGGCKDRWLGSGGEDEGPRTPVVADDLDSTVLSAADTPCGSLVSTTGSDQDLLHRSDSLGQSDPDFPACAGSLSPAGLHHEVVARKQRELDLAFGLTGSAQQ